MAQDDDIDVTLHHQEPDSFGRRAAGRFAIIVAAGLGAILGLLVFLSVGGLDRALFLRFLVIVLGGELAVGSWAIARTRRRRPEGNS